MLRCKTGRLSFAVNLTSLHHPLNPFVTHHHQHPTAKHHPHPQKALQRECNDVRRQLLRCTPSEFERLHAELMAARRAAADAPLAQEQAARHRQMWQEAEERVAKLQVRLTYLCSG